VSGFTTLTKQPGDQGCDKLLGSARVVGTGSMGARYLRVLSTLTESRPLAVPASEVLRNQEITEFASFEQYSALVRPKVDLCVIATDTARHLEDATYFCDSTALLLIEKPLTYSAQALKDFRWPCSKDEVAVSTPLRFMNGFGAVKMELEEIGEVTGVTVECRSWLPAWRPGTDYRRSYSADPIQGGVLLDLIHEIDYCLQLFGAPDKLSAELTYESPLGISSESTAHLGWGYGNFDIRMVLDYVSRPPSRFIMIYGTDKSVKWDLLEASVTTWDHLRGNIEELKFPEDLNIDIVLMRQVFAFVERSGSSLVSSLEQAQQALVLCDLAKKSSEQFGLALNVREHLEVISAE
jgi:predicted dehydrogenase